jgi:hypothetical protein
MLKALKPKDQFIWKNSQGYYQCLWICRATCFHIETGNTFFAWGYGKSKKSAKADVQRHYATAKSPYKFTNITKIKNA